jgi:serine/threonine protein kinase
VTNNDEELLAELLLKWEELYEGGQDSSPELLCQDCPHLIEELRARIAAMKATNWLNNPGCDTDVGSNVTQQTTGKVLGGRYRLDTLIATGGFAEVWQAFDTELQRIVAIKVPKPSRLASSTNFITEARRVARLKHPGIVPVFDVGTEDGRCFIVSEYVEGGSLADRLAKSPPTLPEAVQWLGEIATALEYAHLHGVIHRDIKPANILIDHHGRALLADFGIAQSVQKTWSLAPSLGTLRYMSPEQLEGKAATPQSDVYSLGVVLHDCLAGGLPYSSGDPSVLRREIVEGTAIFKMGVPVALHDVCKKAVSRLPHERHSSAAHFASDVERAEILVDQRPTSILDALRSTLVDRGSPRNRSRSTATVLGVVVAVIFLGALYYQLSLIHQTQLKLAELDALVHRATEQAANSQTIDATRTLQSIDPLFLEKLVSTLNEKTDQANRERLLRQIKLAGAPKTSRFSNSGSINGSKNTPDTLQKKLGPPLVMSGLTTLTQDEATRLAKYRGFLQLDGIQYLSDEAAEALSQHEGGLSLRSLAVVSSHARSKLASAVQPSIPCPAFTSGSLPSRTVTNCVGISLVSVPEGLFSFQFSTSRVTKAQWNRVMGDSSFLKKDADSVMTDVSWKEVELFCRRLSELPEEQSTGRVYRPLTQLEYAWVMGVPDPYTVVEDSLQGFRVAADIVAETP